MPHAVVRQGMWLDLYLGGSTRVQAKLSNVAFHNRFLGSIFVRNTI